MNPISEAAVLQRNYEWFCLEAHGFGLGADGRCSYAAGCAIGVVLPPEIDPVALDDSDPSNIACLIYRGEFEDLNRLFAECNADFLETLQNFHDGRAIDVRDHKMTLGEAKQAYLANLVELAAAFHIDWAPGELAENWPTGTQIAPLPSAVAYG